MQGVYMYDLKSLNMKIKLKYKYKTMIIKSLWFNGMT
jgi:hypothetical protein